MMKFLFICHDCSIDDLEVPEGFKMAGIKDEHAVSQDCCVCGDKKFKKGILVLIAGE
jgi:hypothetical protein